MGPRFDERPGRVECSEPALELQTLDPSEFTGIGGYQNGSEAAGLRCNEKIERTNPFSSGFQRRTHIGIVLRRIECEFGDGEKGQKGFEACTLVRVGPEILLHSRPKLRGHDDGNAGERRIWELLQAGAVAQHRDASAGVEEEGRFHATGDLKLKDRTFVLDGPRRWFREVASVRKLLRQVAGDLGERSELWGWQRLENDLFAVLLDQDLRALKAVGLRQAHGLTPSMLEDLGGIHIYNVYLRGAAVCQ